MYHRFFFSCIASSTLTLAVMSCKQGRPANSYSKAVDSSSGLFYDAYSSLESAYKNTTEENKAILESIRKPSGFWISQETKWLPSILEGATSKKQTAVLVAYNINDRDCSGGHSSGGASSTSAYRQWSNDFITKIGQNSPIVIVEPDALPDSLNCPSPDERHESLKLLVEGLKTKTNSTVYIDGGHSGWKEADEIADLLIKAGIEQADLVLADNSQPLGRCQTRPYALHELREALKAVA